MISAVRLSQRAQKYPIVPSCGAGCHGASHISANWMMPTVPITPGMCPRHLTDAGRNWGTPHFRQDP
jgi:hypothetical protein